MNIERLGWVAAAALAGGMIGMGFRAPGDKTGIVDVGKVFKDSDLAKKQTETLRAQVFARRSVMEFVGNNRNMKKDDADKLHDLMIKDPQSGADKAEIDRIENDAKASELKARDLQTLPKPTEADLAQLNDFTKRKDATGQLLEKWQKDFQDEIQQKETKMNDDTLEKVREAIQQVGKDQGFSIVFANNIAPYCPNDLTTDASTRMNKK
jgi:Skp family chaperone for outer membrane proteins